MALSDIARALSRLQKLQHQVQNVEIQEELLELRREMLDVKAELLDLREHNSELRKKLSQVEDTKELLSNLMDVDGYFYAKDDAGRPIGYPYCPKCMSVSGGPFKTVRQNERYSKCPKCEQIYNAAKGGLVNQSEPIPRSRSNVGW